MRTFSRRYSTKQAGAAQRSERARGQEKNKTEIWQPPRKQARPRASHQCVCPCWWRQCTRQVRGTADAHRTHRWTDARARRDGARGHGLSSSAVRRGGHHHAPLGGAVASDLYRLVSARAGRGGVKLGRGVGLQRLDTAVAV